MAPLQGRAGQSAGNPPSIWGPVALHLNFLGSRRTEGTRNIESNSNRRHGESKMKARSWTALLLMALAFANSPANAAGGSKIQSCLKDVKVMCAGVPSGQGRIGACIQGHFAELSPSCKVTLARAAAAGKACLADFKALCSNVKPGGGRLEACAKAQLPKASDGCKKAAARSAFGSR